MTATYANGTASSAAPSVNGSEERKTTTWMFQETRGDKSSVTAARVSHEEGVVGAEEEVEEKGATAAQLEEFLRTMKNEIERDNNSITTIDSHYPSCNNRIQSDVSSELIVETEEKDKDEDIKDNEESSFNCLENVEQIISISAVDHLAERKCLNERDLSSQSKDLSSSNRINLHHKSIGIDDGSSSSSSSSSLENLRRSIEKDLTIVEDIESFKSKGIVRTYGTLEITDNTTIVEEKKKDDEEEVQKEILHINDQSYDPETELDFYEVVRAGDAKCVATLLATGRVQNLDEPDWNVSGDPPLLVAATNHCLSVLNILLANGCDPGVRSPRGETALHRVILNGGPGNVLNFVGELLKHGCPAGVKEAGGGLTALHVLTRQLAHAQSSKSLHHDYEAALKTLDLLAKAGPINAKDHQGRSALHILASSTVFDNNHRTEIEALIETLLAAGANPALKNDRGESPLHECLECGALNTALLLIPHTPPGIMSRYGETPLHIASRKNYVDMVAKLLEHEEDPSVQDAGGNTPLHLASARGFHQTVSLLVTSPLAQLEKKNLDGLTALQVAAESGFVNAVKLLLKAGADPTQTIHYCSTTLHRHPDISILIDHELTRRRQLAA
ncbi:PREDICTED: ankyrin repeat and protein kinase domain-containing protein 1-like [Polistes canadensis]|uniref:ankyrin repeat and protein kinase domain-containing protein 1-like n=1 Tax=Polistes canadensis TaxID=91411 RepID=UPI0007190488|nr:PREDICTED: ankyrin repeat and protein kinase domain-containing protein 1-like [Polistes canadensis]